MPKGIEETSIEALKPVHGIAGLMQRAQGV